MIKRISLLLFILFSISSAEAQDKALTSGMKLTKSQRIRKAIYQLPAATDSSKPLIRIEGNNITIDFNGAELRGSAMQKRPDQFAGIAILITNSHHVTIRNLKARGYKVVLIARNVQQLIIENCDFSYNYRPELFSNQERESVADWMSYHQNEKDEWLRYGAAMYLKNCDEAIVRDCKVTGGQNALMMTGSDNGQIYNNDFSFNSGIGIGMYRCTGNKILHNRLNFNVRGYSHGIYNRGQDSAGILVFEQSSGNIFYRNSATHSGDGFFLWAGQQTMDTGSGGSNDNLIYKNDFSYAPTNGIEVTFSRNKITGNRVFECDHGIWGGYSYSTSINDNQFRHNRIAIAIEHGLNNSIDYNIFFNDREAIRLWSNSKPASFGGYSTYRDTRSAGYTIAMNSFNLLPLAVNISRTDSVNIFGNTYQDVETLFQFDSTASNIDSSYTELTDSLIEIPEVKNPIDALKGRGMLNGRKNIRMLPWGPYDYRSPLVWWSNPTEKTDTMRFQLLGPKGTWRVKNVKGLKLLSGRQGSFPDSLVAIRPAGDQLDIRLDLEYIGEAITTPQGVKQPAGKAYPFSFRKFFQPIDWEVLFFSMDTSFYNPVKTGQLFSPTVRMAPVKTEKVSRLNYAWWGGLKAGEQAFPQFITVANGKARVSPGKYELLLTWNDAVRVYVDNRLVLNEWNPAIHKYDETPHRKISMQLNGSHDFRVEHLELGGFASLGLELRRVD